MQWLNFDTREVVPIETDGTYTHLAHQDPVIDPTRQVFVIWPNGHKVTPDQLCVPFIELHAFDPKPHRRCMVLGPGEEWAKLLPTKDAYWLSQRESSKQGGGLFLSTEKSWTHILKGSAAGMSLSPNGCRLALLHASHMGTPDLSGRSTVKIIDLCFDQGK
ncbi:MAG: hypothetical protein Alpg2KO_12690 [Alphaproteobacteria bacterium]